MKLKTKSWIYGISGSLILFIFYVVLLTLLNSFSHAISQFINIWYLMLPLIIGFGIQIGLFIYLRGYCKSMGISTTAVGASAGVSGGAMVACCAHHFVEVFALIGIAGASVFFVKYQTTFLVVGIGANILGIIYMRNHIKKMKGGKAQK